MNMNLDLAENVGEISENTDTEVPGLAPESVRDWRQKTICHCFLPKRVEFINIIKLKLQKIKLMRNDPCAGLLKNIDQCFLTELGTLM